MRMCRSYEELTFLGSTLVQLGYKNSAVVTFANPEEYDSVCPPKNDPLPGRGAF